MLQQTIDPIRWVMVAGAGGRLRAHRLQAGDGGFRPRGGPGGWARGGPCRSCPQDDTGWSVAVHHAEVVLECFRPFSSPEAFAPNSESFNYILTIYAHDYVQLGLLQAAFPGLHV